MLITSYIRVPYNIAFDSPLQEKKLDLFLELFIDVMLFLDICASFVTENNSKSGCRSTNREIAWKYMTSYFLFDVISMAGLFWLEEVKRFGLAYDFRYWLKLFRYSYMGRTFDKIDHVLHAIFNERKKHYTKNGVMISKSIIQIGICMHLFACIYIFIGNNPYNCVKTWSKKETERYSLLPPEYAQMNIYVTAIYFVTTTMTTVGYGDYVATTIFERAFVTCL